jgi:hypothetical protein
MGTSKTFHDAFLAENPLCCFCGGQAKATTIDHVPPRALFRGRKWPEGYIFPACHDCNNATRRDELLVGMLARIFPDAEAPEHKAELHKHMAAVNAKFPGLLASMRIPRAQERRLLRERTAPSGKPPSGLLSITDPRFEQAIHQFGTKLMLALFYRHTQVIIPRSGGIPFRWFSNAQNLDEMLPRDTLAPLLGGFADLKRESTSLKDQFFYRYAIADTKNAAAFLAFFNQAIVMLGFVFPDISKVKVPENATVLVPYRRGSQ